MVIWRKRRWTSSNRGTHSCRRREHRRRRLAPGGSFAVALEHARRSWVRDAQQRRNYDSPHLGQNKPGWGHAFGVRLEKAAPRLLLGYIVSESESQANSFVLLSETRLRTQGATRCDRLRSSSGARGDAGGVGSPDYWLPAGTAPYATRWKQPAVYPITTAPEGADYAVGDKIRNHCTNPSGSSGCLLGNQKFKLKGPKGTFEYTFGSPDDPSCGSCPTGGITVEAD